MFVLVTDYTLRNIMSANDQGIVAVIGRAHCQRQVAFFFARVWPSSQLSESGLGVGCNFFTLLWYCSYQHGLSIVLPWHLMWAGDNMIHILNNGYFIHRRYLWQMPQSISLLTTINISVKLVLLSWQETDIWDDVRSGFDIVINIPNVIFETGTYVLFKYGNTVRMEQDRTNPVIHCLNVKSKVAKLFPFQITLR